MPATPRTHGRSRWSKRFGKISSSPSASSSRSTTGRTLLGPESWRVFVEDVVAGAYRLEPLTVHDLQRASEFERRYSDLDLGLVDASVIALCERLGETKVATLDRRDFSVVRPQPCEHLALLPT